MGDSSGSGQRIAPSVLEMEYLRWLGGISTGPFCTMTRRKPLGKTSLRMIPDQHAAARAGPGKMQGDGSYRCRPPKFPLADFYEAGDGPRGILGTLTRRAGRVG